MKKQPAPLTEAEWRIMKIVWGLGNCTAREVYTTAGEQHSLAPTTVKTFLSILVDKGYLSTKRTGNRFNYQPKRTYIQSLKHSADVLLDKANAENIGALLAYAVKKCKLGKEDVAEVRDALDGKKSRK